MNTLRPASIMKIDEIKAYDWEVKQEFYLLGRKMTVTGWGFDRKSALERFRLEKWYAEQDLPPNSLSIICGVIYDLSGWIDTVLLGFRSIK